MIDSTYVGSADSSLDKILIEDEDDTFTDATSLGDLSNSTGGSSLTYDTPFGSQKKALMDMSDKIFVFTSCCVGDPSEFAGRNFRNDTPKRRSSVTSEATSTASSIGDISSVDSALETSNHRNAEIDKSAKISSDILNQHSLAPSLTDDEPIMEREKQKIKVIKCIKMQRRGIYKDTSRPIMVIKKDGTRQAAEEYNREEALLADDPDDDENQIENNGTENKFWGINESEENELPDLTEEGQRRVVYARHRIKRMCVDIETGQKVKGQLKRHPPRTRRPRKSLKESSKEAVAAGIAVVSAGAIYMAERRARQAAWKKQQKEEKARKKLLKKQQKEAEQDTESYALNSHDEEIKKALAAQRNDWYDSRDGGDRHTTATTTQMQDTNDLDEDHHSVETKQQSTCAEASIKEEDNEGDNEEDLTSDDEISKKERQHTGKDRGAGPSIKKVARGAALAGGALAGGAVVAARARVNRKKRAKPQWEEAVKQARKAEVEQRRKKTNPRSSKSTRRGKNAANEGVANEVPTNTVNDEAPSNTSTQREIEGRQEEEIGESNVHDEHTIAEPNPLDSPQDYDIEEKNVSSNQKAKMGGLLAAAGVLGVGTATGTALFKKRRAAKPWRKNQNHTSVDDDDPLPNADDGEEAYHLPFEDEIEVEFDGDSNIVFMPLRDTYNGPEW